MSNVAKIASEATAGFGGYLRCESCGRRSRSLTKMQQASYYADGWPRCCGYTMRWWTQRQIDAAEVPPVADDLPAGTENQP